MSRNSTLANALLLLKGEIGLSLTALVNVAQDSELYTLLDTKQQWLADKYEWPFLETRGSVTITAGEGGRYGTFPTTLRAEKLSDVSVLFNERWQPVTYGIGNDEYNTFSSGDGSVAVQAQDPIMKWRLYGTTQFEIWPIASSAQTVRFTGQATLTSLKAASVYSDTTTLDLDDILVVLFAAAEKLSRMKKTDAAQKLAMAEDRLNTLRSNYPGKDQMVVFGGSSDRRPIQRVSVASP